ncbi:MAG: hypothetical protein GX416_14525 [Bacteroidales bacterium]|nr:hypothetical protein [Bacteroidales bacterium]
MKKHYLCLLLAFYCCTLNAQQVNPVGTKSVVPIFNKTVVPTHGTSFNFLPPSPQAAGLGLYGQIPIGNFTGTAEIEIPLYNINYKELSVPLFLSYHASGIRPDLFPGPVGMGWSLQAGGVITRVIKGESDFGDRIANTNSGGGMLEIQADGRTDAAWSSTAKLSYPLMMDYDANPVADPDEYYVSINGRTGHFYINPDSTFTIQTKDGGCFQIQAVRDSLAGEFQALAQTRTDTSVYIVPYKRHVNLRDVLKTFVLTDEKDIKYTFGGSINSVECSRPGFNEVNNYATDYMGAYVQLMSWFLVSIESPNGYKIRFDYEKNTHIDIASFQDMAQYNSTTAYNYNYSDGYKSTMINGCYLKTITFPEGRVDLYNSVASNQLDYPHATSYNNAIFTNYLNNFHDYPDVSNANTEKITSVDAGTDMTVIRNRFFPLKLDSIRVSSLSGAAVRRIRLNYTADTSVRMKLMSVVLGDDEQHDRYTLKYNPTQLPAYLSNQTDYYGFYNGPKSSIFSYTNSSNLLTYVKNNPQCYDTIKKPSSNAVYHKAGMLEEIHYPTGGYTALEYEPNRYGRTARIWPFSVIENSAGNSLVTGGVRIKTVRNYSKSGTLLKELKYHYVKNYAAGDTVSSGVLCYVPQYVQGYNNITLEKYIPLGTHQTINVSSYFYFNSNPFFPMSTLATSHVTYTEVAVEEPGNGFTVYSYKNYDNGYNDTSPLNAVSDTVRNSNNEVIPLWKTEEGQSLALERGQILAEKVYTQNGVLKRNTQYLYNDSQTRFGEGVRYIHLYPSIIDKIQQLRVRVTSAGLYYTYYPYLREKTTTEYRNVNLENSESYTYTDSRLLKTKTGYDSRGQERKTTFIYPADITGSSLFLTMVGRHLLDYPVEIVNSLNGTFLSKSAIEYTLSNNSLILPYKIKKQYAGSLLYVDYMVSQYDSIGNPLSVIHRDGSKEAYLWCMNGARLGAHIAGADYTQMLNILGNSYISTLYHNNNDSRGAYYHIRNALSSAEISPTEVMCYTYSPLNGISSKTDAAGMSLYYEYDTLGRLTTIYRINTDGDREIINNYEYNYAH